LLGYFRVNVEAPKGTAAVADESLEDAPLIGSEGTLFCGTFEPRAAVRTGDSVDVTIDPERLHFFDPETEESLRR
jgi:multiple sugar transport system ATP-binding protein